MRERLPRFCSLRRPPHRRCRRTRRERTRYKERLQGKTSLVRVFHRTCARSGPSTVAAVYDRRQSRAYEIAGGHFLRLRAAALALRVLRLRAAALALRVLRLRAAALALRVLRLSAAALSLRGPSLQSLELSLCR